MVLIHGSVVEPDSSQEIENSPLIDSRYIRPQFSKFASLVYLSHFKGEARRFDLIQFYDYDLVSLLLHTFRV